MFEDGDVSCPSQERTRGTKQQLRKNDSAQMRARRLKKKTLTISTRCRARKSATQLKS
jgi:hypothetical protein